tara:strand:+ start:454 stop:633 length:180 start_codon:yes stop_codon:yes gene_type:complete
MSLIEVLLFLILVTMVTYTFMPWKGIDKGSGIKLYGQWFVWALIVGILIFILTFFGIVN